SRPERVLILGVPVDCVDMDGALAAVDDMIAGDRAHTILAVNPEKIMAARRDAATLESLRQASLLIPDGIGAVLGIRLLHRKRVDRVPGSELMPRLCERSVDEGYRLFLYGASEAVNARAVEVLTERYPGVRIVGRQHGFMAEEQMPELVERINESGAQILFVALGSPRQELWINRYMPRLTSVKVYQGVGGTFNVIAGEVRRAPEIFCRLHLEWFYRLMTDPRRIARQIVLPWYALLVLRQKLTGHN
ncbi:MAG: WecB/TagA/CpsF family glycosyltransferase, partial [Gammaproteobacteria bacterium]